VSRSLKDQCTRLLGITTFPISIRRDYMGYTSGFGPTSVASQVLRLKFRQIHLNVIRVGSEQFTSADERELDAAVQFMRNAYAPFGAVAIGRVQRFDIPNAAAQRPRRHRQRRRCPYLTESGRSQRCARAFFVRRCRHTSGLSEARNVRQATVIATGVVVEMNMGGGGRTGRWPRGRALPRPAPRGRALRPTRGRTGPGSCSPRCHQAPSAEHTQAVDLRSGP
jgi:hypothetical protein